MPITPPTICKSRVRYCSNLKPRFGRRSLRPDPPRARRGSPATPATAEVRIPAQAALPGERAGELGVPRPTSGKKRGRSAACGGSCALPSFRELPRILV